MNTRRWKAQIFRFPTPVDNYSLKTSENRVRAILTIGREYIVSRELIRGVVPRRIKAENGANLSQEASDKLIYKDEVALWLLSKPGKAINNPFIEFFSSSFRE